MADAIILTVEVEERAGLAVGSPTVDPIAPSALTIELQLANGRCLRLDPGLDTAMLMWLIRAVKAA